jgi:hypothetical protein
MEADFLKILVGQTGFEPATLPTGRDALACQKVLGKFGLNKYFVAKGL